ncbi:hypothetical protein H6G65_07820 [Microcystis elabens FACHB-917]|nr:hypothetical protein [Microcystis elabens FACHB-917]
MQPPSSPLPSLSFLVAPLGQLSEDGQLRELIEERRQRKGAEPGLWYLAPELVDELCLGPAFRPASPDGHGRLPPELWPRREQRIEAIVAGDAAVITWLQLRFGGCTGTITIPVSWLQERATGVPAPASPPLSSTKSTTTERAPTL